MITAKVAIFDVDCTLVDTLKRFFVIFNELLDEMGNKPISWKHFFKVYVDDTLDEIIAPPGTGGREKRLHDFWLKFLRMYREDDPGSKLIPGVRPVFRKLYSKGVPIAVITSCIVPPAKLRKELAGFGLAKYISAIATAHDVVYYLERGHHFSKVEILQKAAERLGVDSKDCVVTGDYWNDIRDGKKFGAKTVAVLTGRMRRELLERYHPDAIIDGVKDLLKVVKFEAES